MLSERWHREHRTTSKPAFCGLEELEEVDVLDERLEILSSLREPVGLIDIGLVRRPAACVCSCMSEGGEAMLTVVS